MNSFPPLAAVYDLYLTIDGRSTLANISIEFPPLSFTTLMGPGGSGKSTLLRLLGGYLPHATTVRFAGTVLRPKDQVAYVSQRPRSTGDILRNLLNEAGGDAFRYLDDNDWAAYLTQEGLDRLSYPLDTQADHLTRAEQQILRIAAARWRNPALILLDEPFAGVFGPTADELIDYVATLRGKHTVIHVEHHQGRARALANRVALLAAGQLIEIADVHTFFENPQSPHTAQYIQTGGVSLVSVDAEVLIASVDPVSGFRVPIVATTSTEPPVDAPTDAEAAIASANAHALAGEDTPTTYAEEPGDTDLNESATVTPVVPQDAVPRDAETTVNAPDARPAEPVATDTPSQVEAAPAGRHATTTSPITITGPHLDEEEIEALEQAPYLPETPPIPERDRNAPARAFQRTPFAIPKAVEDDEIPLFRPPKLPSFTTLRPPARHPIEGSTRGRGPQNFSWMIKNELAGCPRPGIVEPIGRDLDRLARAGIDVIVSLTQTPLNIHPSDLQLFHEVSHFPIVDMRAPDPGLAQEVVRQMETHIRAGRSVVYHCRAGLGRTGTMLVLHLIARGMNAADALQTARATNPYWVQSEEQEAFLHEQPVGFLAPKR